MRKGSCNCGGVTFTVAGDLPPPSLCHCGQCRRQSGHAWASTRTAEEAVTFETDATLTWYASSDVAKRGFCSVCGAFLFWKHLEEPEISIAMGSLEMPTGLSLGKHIFVADKGDYYEIADGLPQRDA